jgi:SAM-dependent methyltransferase
VVALVRLAHLLLCLSWQLDANTQATERIVSDLNSNPILPFDDDTFDLVTNVSSVDYLTRPRDVFAEIHRVLRPGGCVAVTFSNRCFDSKAVALWLRKIADGAALAEVVCNYLHFGAPGGWAHVGCADISPRNARCAESPCPLRTVTYRYIPLHTDVTVM